MKKNLADYMAAYQKQMAIGDVPKAYRGLMEYMMGLRTHFLNHHADDYVIGHLYQGYMDMSYFAVTPFVLKQQKLKIGLFFNHEKIRFECWLVGQNKTIQEQFWKQFNTNGRSPYPISATARRSIIEFVIVEQPDFSRLDQLTDQLEKSTLAFITAIRAFLD